MALILLCIKSCFFKYVDCVSGEVAHIPLENVSFEDGEPGLDTICDIWLFATLNRNSSTEQADIFLEVVVGKDDVSLIILDIENWFLLEVCKKVLVIEFFIRALHLLKKVMWLPVIQITVHEPQLGVVAIVEVGSAQGVGDPRIFKGRSQVPKEDMGYEVHISVDLTVCHIYGPIEAWHAEN